MQNENYYIANDKGDYWSNEWGWTEFNSADQFTDFETRILKLPMGGRWVKA